MSLRTVINFWLYSMNVPPYAGFLGKILPDRREAWRFFPKPEGLDLADGKEHSLLLPKIISLSMRTFGTVRTLVTVIFMAVLSIPF